MCFDSVFRLWSCWYTCYRFHSEGVMTSCKLLCPNNPIAPSLPLLSHQRRVLKSTRLLYNNLIAIFYWAINEHLQSQPLMEAALSIWACQLGPIKSLCISHCPGDHCFLISVSPPPPYPPIIWLVGQFIVQVMMMHFTCSFILAYPDFMLYSNTCIWYVNAIFIKLLFIETIAKWI